MQRCATLRHVFCLKLELILFSVPGAVSMRSGGLSGVRPQLSLEPNSSSAKRVHSAGVDLARSHASLSHDGEYAVAFVVLMRHASNAAAPDLNPPALASALETAAAARTRPASADVNKQP
jgi:hypothetical protein